jgi:glycosyltransferase involved in cell wall biosynthesis
MALVILDPNLEGEAGHHLAYDMAIARGAMARGEAVSIVANRRFAASTVEGVRILPHFSASTYAALHRDPVTGAADDWRGFNDLLQAELAVLPRTEFRPGDAVLVPTTTENHLAGYIGWMKSFDPLEAPLFVLHLMFPSGVTVDAAGRQVVEEPFRALFYRLADRVAQEEGPPVHLFASGGQHATEFSALFGRPIPPHPLPIRPEPDPASPPAPRRALLFAGDARADKGVALLPDLVPRLAGAHADWTFVAHVNGNAAWGEAREAVALLEALPARLPGFELAGGRLRRTDYMALARGVGIALFPYDPVLYRRKSSGVLWEAISLGTPVVVPAGTWLENEARHWGAGHLAYAGHSAEAIAAAFAAALPRIDELAAQSAEAGRRYRAANGAAALMDQIAALWVRHKAAASLVARPAVMAIDLARLEGGWHRPEALDGRTVRWAIQEPAIAFDWPFEEPWQLDITLLSFFGADQLDRIEVQAGALPVSFAWQREGRGARLVLRGAGPGRARPRIDLRLRLPHTYRPQNDARDLGMLVGSMEVGPALGAAGATMPEAAAVPSLHVDAPALPEGGWPLHPGIGGVLRAAPDRPCVLAFRLRGAPATPPILTLHLAGASAGLRLSPEGEGVWLGTATLPPALLRAGGEPMRWDLLAEGATGQAVTLISAEATTLAGTTRPLATAAPPPPDMSPPDGPRLRWDLSRGFGPSEGPFPDLGVPADVRWIVARAAQLAVETDRPGPARLSLRYRCLLPRQGMRVTLDGGTPMLVEIEGAGLRQSGEIVLDLTLRAGMNDVALTFDGGVREPGTGRELVLLLEQAAFG